MSRPERLIDEMNSANATRRPLVAGRQPLTGRSIMARAVLRLAVIVHIHTKVRLARQHAEPTAECAT